MNFDEWEDKLVEEALRLDDLDVPQEGRIKVLTKEEVEVIYSWIVIDYPTKPGFWLNVHCFELHVPEDFFDA